MRRQGFPRLLLGLVILTLGLGAARGAGIGPEEFARRREALAERLRKGVVVLQAKRISRGRVEEIDGNTPKYDFYYLTGCEGEGSIYLQRVDTGEVALFLPDKGRREKRAARKAGIDKVLPLKSFPKTLRKWLTDGDPRIWAKAPSRAPRGEWVGKLEALAPGAEIRDVRDELVRLRIIKSEAEVGVLRKVAEIGAEGLVKVIPKIRPGVGEGEVADAIRKLYKRAGAQRLSFPPIVGSGRNGTIIHYTQNADSMRPGDLVVMDVGAELDHYASDISRTVPVSGRFSPRQREIYQTVLDAQTEAEGRLKPGITLVDLNRIANEVIQARGFPRIPHFVGHFVGLSVHDSGLVATPLEPGMVITIEPGIYLRKEGIGVRIEDTYLVTESGFERLSRSVPRTIEEIEALRGRR